ncbi:hypothetical protein ACFL5Y_02050 [Candidatus Omnitrophota bacterium]
MKKILSMLMVFVVVIFVLMGAPETYAGDYDHWYTDGAVNGHFIAEDKEGSESAWYMAGIIQMAYRMYPAVMQKVYPEATIRDVMEAIRNYYQVNPTQRDRRVIDVLLSGGEEKSKVGVITSVMNSPGGYNGYYLVSDYVPVRQKATYVKGVFWGISQQTGFVVAEEWASRNFKDIYDGLKKYYENNPSKLSSPISSILAGVLSGEI